MAVPEVLDETDLETLNNPLTVYEAVIDKEFLGDERNVEVLKYVAGELGRTSNVKIEEGLKVPKDVRKILMLPNVCPTSFRGNQGINFPGTIQATTASYINTGI